MDLSRGCKTVWTLISWLQLVWIYTVFKRGYIILKKYILSVYFVAFGTFALQEFKSCVETGAQHLKHLLQSELLLYHLTYVSDDGKTLLKCHVKLDTI